MRQPRYPAWARWGLHVADRETGEALFDLEGGNRFVPGSVTKLFPASAILLRFGPDHRFETPVYRTGPVADGVLDGDLVLVASGDPMMGGRTLADGRLAYGEIDHTDANALPGVALLGTNPLAGLDDLATQVAAAGIRRIEGEVIVDARLFPQMPKDDYVLSPIVVNDNVVDVLVTPGEAGQPATVALRPVTAAYRAEGTVETAAAGSNTAWTVDERAPGVVRVAGAVAAGGGPELKTASVQDPPTFARTLFVEALDRAGIAVADPLGPNPAPPDAAFPQADRVAVLHSRPLADLITVTLKVSMNLYADTLVMLLGSAEGVNQDAWEDGFTVIREEVVTLGLDPAAVSLGDGRGNDRADMFGPRAICDLLRGMATRPEGETLATALPILGVDGTEAGAVGADSPVRGRAAAKSGTVVVGDLLNGRLLLLGKASAGYMTGRSGREVVYATFVNDVPLAQVEDIFAIVADQGALAAALFEAI
jgi:D-alanyl-D-alanine carboxypeptidase/D-alanyl-D-alanine-endopeptidase (penicillin-binding protein 4)